MSLNRLCRKNCESMYCLGARLTNFQCDLGGNQDRERHGCGRDQRSAPARDQIECVDLTGRPLRENDIHPPERLVDYCLPARRVAHGIERRQIKLLVVNHVPPLHSSLSSSRNSLRAKWRCDRTVPAGMPIRSPISLWVQPSRSWRSTTSRLSSGRTERAASRRWPSSALSAASAGDSNPLA